MPFGAADVFAAVAAISAAMIALQVMAQTSHVQPSRILAERGPGSSPSEVEKALRATFGMTHASD